VTELRHWQEITPAQALEEKLDLSVRLDITAPLNEEGERCPWPWEPQQLVNVAMGMYHCGYCLAMCIAGLEHIDYSEDVDPNVDERDSAYLDDPGDDDLGKAGADT
jgi:hypothetical protein